jgi:hypothetical protein
MRQEENSSLKKHHTLQRIIPYKQIRTGVPPTTIRADYKSRLLFQWILVENTVPGDYMRCDVKVHYEVRSKPKACC